MTSNRIRLRIISSILRMPKDKLPAVLELCQAQLRIELPPDLPEWIPLTVAAALLQLHPGSLRRLATSSYPLLIDRRRTPRGQVGIYLNRSAVSAIATRSTRATTRHTSATHKTFRAHPTQNAHLEHSTQDYDKTTESPGNAERFLIPIK